MPAVDTPPCTKKAPVNITAVSPRLSSTVITGLLALIVSTAFCSARDRPRLRASNASLSFFCEEKAFITRIPLHTCRTLRTMESAAACARTYSLRPKRLIKYTPVPKSGSTAVIISASRASMAKEKQSPPISSIGARTPMRCIMPTVWCIL